MMRVVLLACVLAAAGSGCQKASDATQAKRMPQPPPAPEIRVPDALRIEVVVGGKDTPAIDAARLRATPPDFADSERRAWRLTTLLGPTVGAGTELVIT